MERSDKQDCNVMWTKTWAWTNWSVLDRQAASTRRIATFFDDVKLKNPSVLTSWEVLDSCWLHPAAIPYGCLCNVDLGQNSRFMSPNDFFRLVVISNIFTNLCTTRKFLFYSPKVKLEVILDDNFYNDLEIEKIAHRFFIVVTTVFKNQQILELFSPTSL